MAVTVVAVEAVEAERGGTAWMIGHPESGRAGKGLPT